MWQAETAKLFLLIFFLLYGGMHLYFYEKVRGAFLPKAGALVFWACFLSFCFLAPLVMRFAEGRDWETVVRLTAWSGYLWMAFLLLFCFLAFLLDVYRLLLRLLARLGKAEPLVPSPRWLFFLPLTGAMLLCLYGLFEARQVGTTHIVVRSERLSAGLRIVQISDVHIGVLVKGERLAEILRKVQEAKPDLLVCTGDLLDGQLNRMEEAAAMLRQIRPPLGKYAVMGNHEFYAGLDEAQEFLQKSGVTPLRNRKITVGGLLDLAGVDDPAVHGVRKAGNDAEGKLLSPRAGRFTVLLKHQPFALEDGEPLFDLQLSGHTHRGQVFPFSLVTRLFFPHHSGLYRLKSGALIYVSPGSGTWGPPVRLLAPPEVTIIDLLPKGPA